MAGEFSVKVTGMAEVQKALYAYSQQLGDKVVVDSLKQGARLVQRAAKAGAPVKTGRLKRAIVVKKSRIYNGRFHANKIGVYLTIKQGRRYGAADAYYGRFQEEGWEVRGATRTAANTPFRVNRHGTKKFSRSASGGRKTLPGRQHVLGKFFIRDAFYRNRTNAVRMIIEAASSGAEILARKTGLK